MGFGGGGGSPPIFIPPPPPPIDPQIEIDRQKRVSRDARARGIQVLLAGQLDEEATLGKRSLLGT